VTRRHLLTALVSSFVPEQAFSWIDLDLLHQSRTVHWAEPNELISFGSLLKPFLMLAFSATHSSFPVVTCHGTRDRCWLPRGHGEQSIVPALANSCNCYFLHLAKLLDRAALDAVCLRYGLSRPARSLGEDALVGLGSGWRNTPLAVVQAFAQVTDPTVLRGMEQCAAKGTARKLELPVYAKTGTAPCSHRPRGAGDGFVVVLYPTAQPRRVVLFEEHGTTGAEACRAVKGKIDFH
jgi:cell division protein FtsI/penicillin-binding protein 2